MMGARVVYDTPEVVVERLQEYWETLGITGVSLDVHPGQWPEPL